LETIFCRSSTLYLTRFKTYKIARLPQTKTKEGRGQKSLDRKILLNETTIFIAV
jgi:hypothetical protein